MMKVFMDLSRDPKTQQDDDKKWKSKLGQQNESLVNATKKENDLRLERDAKL